MWERFSYYGMRAFLILYMTAPAAAGGLGFASEIFFASDEIKEDYPSVLIGNYQIFNKKTVLKTIEVIKSMEEFEISEEHIKSGFLNVVKNTGLQGRWQQLQENPTVICDTAHNADGLKIVLTQLQQQQFQQLHIVFGVVND